jgi:hypothetical protein
VSERSKIAAGGYVSSNEIRKVTFSTLNQIYAKVVTTEQLKGILGD